MLTKRRRGAAAVAVALAGALLATSCGGSDSGSPDGKTLKLWHYEGPDSAMGVAWKEAIKEFEAQHPGVKVKFEEKGFEQIQKTAPMVLNSNDAPDIMEYNKGNATAGLLSKQGLLTDLTAEAGRPRLGQEAQRRCEDHEPVRHERRHGLGQVVRRAQLRRVHGGLLQQGPLQEVRDRGAYHVRRTGLRDGRVRGEGRHPLANAGAEYMAQQYLYQLALSKADRSWVDTYELYKGKADFHDTAWSYAADTFADWVEKGYISKKSSGTKAEDAGVSWIQGKSPILFSGSWWYGRFESEATFDWDSGLFPGSNLTLGSGGNLWVVPKGAENKELAYDFIDITMSKKIQNLLGNKGGVPVAADTSAITDARTKTLIADYNTLSERDGLAFYPDWPVAGFYDTLVSETQKLITGSAKPDAYLDNLQKAYDKGVPQR